MIDIVPFQASWAGDYQLIAEDLRSALGDRALRIDHIGSTSVPGLAAKNIIDLQVTVAALEAGVVERLLGAGFVRLSHVNQDHLPPGFSGPEEDWSKFLFVEVEGQRRSNIHVRRASSPNQRYALLFRDFLRDQPQVAAAYGELKRRLAGALADDDDYPEVKDPAVDLIYFAAEAWASRSGWSVEQGGA